MPISIIRIRNLQQELNLDNVIFPVDKSTYGDNARRIDILDLKKWILSGITFSGGTGGTGTSGTDGTSGTSPCITLISNTIRIFVDVCSLEGMIECDISCDLIGTIDCSV